MATVMCIPADGNDEAIQEVGTKVSARFRGPLVAYCEAKRLILTNAIAEKEAAKMPDGASGDVKIYRVEGMDKVEIDEAQHGIFFGGDSYVIQYDNPGANVKIVYFWQGLRSSTDEKGASALLAKQIDEEEFGGRATQVDTRTH
uniref:Gelsolin-like domain-containing protein n=1 Tax=Branchiostoma floridae TaxID=7739 RepID=C3Z9K1_BRAFL|eukprot:XP_002594686.1 hypothetical protein BRAFLDRAFT_104837 [Branchiostoma floridae]